MFRHALLSLGMFSVATPAAAGDAATTLDSPARCAGNEFSARSDNDLFGGRHQDQGYTAGAEVTAAFPIDVTCIRSRAVRTAGALAQRMGHARLVDPTSGFTLSFSQALYTPQDGTSRDPVAGDRPYASVVLATVQRHDLSPTQLTSSRIQLGAIGPLTLGKQTHDMAHRLLRSQRFDGWDNQIANEPLINASYGRYWRWPPDAERDIGTWGWDSITHLQGSIGNRLTSLDSGVELRAGWNLPSDFGSSPVHNPLGNTFSCRSLQCGGWSLGGFAIARSQWILHDITLDGNTFSNSHSVEKRQLVNELGYGILLRYRRLSLVVARYHRTKEFREQAVAPVYGSLSISYAH